MANKKRGYVNVSIETTERVYIEDILDEIKDEDLIAEAGNRGLFKPKPFDINRETISDFFGKSRYTPLPELMKLLQEKLESE